MSLKISRALVTVVLIGKDHNVGLLSNSLSDDVAIYNNLLPISEAICLPFIFVFPVLLTILRSNLLFSRSTMEMVRSLLLLKDNTHHYQGILVSDFYFLKTSIHLVCFLRLFQASTKFCALQAMCVIFR